MLILAFIGLLCMQTLLQRYISVALESNTFQKKKKKSSSKDLRTIITNIFRIEQYNSVMSLMLFLIC